MPPRPPAQRRTARPRAWRVTDQKPAAGWRRFGFPVLAVAVAAAIGGTLLAVSGAFGSAAPRPTPSPTAAPARQIVSSTLSGSTPTPTFTPLPSTPVPPVGGADQPAASAPAFSAGPPALVQQVTPVTAAKPAAAASASPAAAASSTPRPSASPSTSRSIEDELRALNATATALAGHASTISQSPTARASGTPKPTATDTPIPTAAPPFVPKPTG